MITLPDLNEAIRPLGGKLLPFGWAKLLWWLRKPKVRTMRVPLMGVVKELQASRMASQLAFMMIEYIRRASVARYGATRGRSEEHTAELQALMRISYAVVCLKKKKTPRQQVESCSNEIHTEH